MSLEMRILLFAFLIVIASCSDNKTEMNNMDSSEMESQESDQQQAVVLSVTFTGEENNYNFKVELKSPDTGCDQYANWWEIIDENESLIYRRILTHSHVTEQPFIRSGGPVKITNTQKVYVRGHMNKSGYGSMVFSGTIKDGLKAEELDPKFAEDLETKAPLPAKCEF